MTLAEAIDLLSRLNVNKQGNAVAPHKAVLLLSVFDMISAGEIDAPFIPITPVLERRFHVMWRKYVPKDAPFNAALNYPFFHLKSAPFWTLVKLPTYEERAEHSLASLKRSFAGAVMDAGLFELLRNGEVNRRLQSVLISAYLPAAAVSGIRTWVIG